MLIFRKRQPTETRRQNRGRLRDLPDHLLKDIGLNRSQVWLDEDRS